MSSTYTLPDTDPTSPLTDPSHSALHNSIKGAIASLSGRVGTLEDLIPTTAENIEQARLVAHQWYVHGELTEAQTHMILMPLIWNITTRSVTFYSAKATVLTPADQDITVDIVVGTELTGAEHDHDDETQTSILVAPLTIPAGAFYSDTIYADDFVGHHPVDSYLAAFIEDIGSVTAPGADLNIQLNRLL